MDLLRYLSRAINFTYSLALSPDGQFGHYIIKNYSIPGAKKEWTGLIGMATFFDDLLSPFVGIHIQNFGLQESWCMNALI